MQLNPFPERQPLSIIDIFPEIKRVSENQITDIDKGLNLKETIIQNAIRLAFRSKGSFPIARRDKDSPLEVADIEHFLIKLKGKTLSFTVVVKGQNSISGKKKKLNWEHISHQVTKAYNTHPDYIMIATAIGPVDRLITEMNLYALSVGKPNLIVFVPPVDLARFLSWRGII